jgi:uncharacterized protein YjbI with pentapeptide repeats
MNDDNTNIPNGQDPVPKPGGNDDEKKKRREIEIRKKEEQLKKKEEALSRLQGSRKKEAQKIKEDLEHSSAVNRSLLVFFLLAMTYFLVIVASTKDLQLLLPNSTIQLPILGVELDLINFYLFSPFILIVIHFNFLFSLCQHTKKLSRLKELEKDMDDPLPHSSFLINLLIKPKTIRKGGEVVKDYRAPYYLIRLLLWIVIYLYPLSILVLFQWRFADYHSLWITFVHLLYIIIDVILLSFFWIRISTPSFKSQTFSIFPASDNPSAADPSEGGIPNRLKVCDAGRDKIDKVFLFFPCLVKTTIGYLKKNTGTVNLIIILLLVLVQVRTFGLLKLMDYLSPGTAYRVVNNHPLLAIPRLVVIGKPVVDHYRKLDLPLPYTDSIGSLKEPIEGLLTEYRRSGKDTTDKSQQPPGGETICQEPLKNVNHPCNKLPEISLSTENQLVLSGRDLRFAILDRSDLTGVVLKKAKLQGASLMETKLDLADMTEANLNGANLKKSWLRGAIFNGAHLEEAILEQACMPRAWLEKASLDGADLTDAKLNFAVLTGASAIGAIMQKAKLYATHANRAVFRAADLSHVDFTCSELQNADFYASDLSKTILRHTNLMDAKLVATKLEGSDISQAVFARCRLVCCKFDRCGFKTGRVKVDQYALLSNQRI